MNLREYCKILLETTADDWNRISSWGAYSGPSYHRGGVDIITTGSGKFEGLERDEHGEVAVLKRDLAISIAWGYRCNEDYKEEWANQFSDPRASSSFIDFFYNGVMVWRDVYVSVDGARCKIPQSRVEREEESFSKFKQWIPEEKVIFFHMFNELASSDDFTSYFRRTGFEVRDVPWMC